jgi:YVTN family beta-propeller protein
MTTVAARYLGVAVLASLGILTGAQPTASAHRATVATVGSSLISVRPVIIQVGGNPSAVASAFGAVWVLNGSEIVRVDARTKRVVARISVGQRVGGEQPCGLAIGDKWIWLLTSRGDLVRLDPTTNSTAATGLRVSGAACVAATATAVWISVPYQRAVIRFDPVRKVVIARVPAGLFPEGMAIVGQSIWVSSGQRPCDGKKRPCNARHSDRGEVVRIDSRTNRPVARAIVEHSPNQIAASGDQIWVTSNTGTVARVTATRGQLSITRRVFVNGSTGVVLRGKTLWATNTQPDGTITAIDVRTFRVTSRVRVGSEPVGIASDNTGIWVANFGDGTLSFVRLR